MSQAVPRGIDRNGLDASLEAAATFKSNRIEAGPLRRAQDQPDAAADHFARAAAIEERLGTGCAALGLAATSWVHRLRAARHRGRC